MNATLQRPCLVLNRSWQPVHVSTVAKAIVQVCKGAALVIDPATYQTFTWSDWSEVGPTVGEAFVRSMRSTYRVPEVIQLTSYDRLPKRSVTFSRRNIYKRDHFQCQYCGKNPGGEELTIDHVTPRAHGGISSWTNCVLACIECNSRKADRTPQQAEMRLKKEPVLPAWKPLYADHRLRLDSWRKFISDAFWMVPLEK
jgi:5-methylcytosine-specific restriction endonuclease McrA